MWEETGCRPAFTAAPMFTCFYLEICFLEASVSIVQCCLAAAGSKLSGKCILQIFEETFLFHVLFGNFVYPPLRN